MTSTLDPQTTLDAQVITWRRWLHEHPELSFQEHATADYVEAQLRGMNGLELSRPTPTSVLAVLKGEGGSGRTLLMRADMDALPIQEDTTYDFASKNDGVMHACGHDGHTAMLLGAAQVLSGLKAQLPGEIRFIFQHAEELFPGGGQQLVDAGIMQGVDLAVGAHLFSPIPVGLIALKSGPLMAAPDTFTLTVTGKGGHGAMPHETVDPILIACHIVTALQAIVSRQRDPLEPAVLSVTTIHAGKAHNVIPNAVMLSGTVRTFDAGLREQIPQWMERLIQGVTQGFGATYQFEYEFGYRATVNDPEVTEVMREVVRETLGSQALIEAQQTMGGEDFSAYLSQAPGAFFFIGARNEAAGISAPHHHPQFAIDEEALSHGVKVLVAAGRRLTTSDLTISNPT